MLLNSALIATITLGPPGVETPDRGHHRLTPDLTAAARLDTLFAPSWSQDAVSEALEPAPARFGATDTWRIYVYGGGGVDLNDSDGFGVGGVGFSYFVLDGLSLDIELNGLYFAQQEGDDALGINANLLFRWHFFTRETWSIYFEGGAGGIYATEKVPPDGTQWNFTPQAGGGVTFEIRPDVRLMTGVRWHHISNANLSSDNAGKDSIMAYVGVNWSF